MTDTTGPAATLGPRAEAMMNANPELALAMERLSDDADSAWRELDATWRRVEEARQAKQRTAAILAELEDYDRRGLLLTEERDGTYHDAGGVQVQTVTRNRDGARLEAARQAAEAAAARLGRATEAHHAAKEAWEQASRISERCERYLSGLERCRNVPLEAAMRRGDPHKRADLFRQPDRVRTIYAIQTLDAHQMVLLDECSVACPSEHCRNRRYPVIGFSRA